MQDPQFKPIVYSEKIRMLIDYMYDDTAAIEAAEREIACNRHKAFQMGLRAEAAKYPILKVMAIRANRK